jgi:Ser-tRNA(Ala) deacylase AlaX
MGEERGFVLDEKGYEAARDRHAAVSRGDGDGDGVSKEKRVRAEHREALARVGGAVGFTGYDRERDTAPVAALLRADGDNLSLADALREGEAGQLITATTPFYGESGGQVGDGGTITTATGTFTVTDTQKPTGGLVVHLGRVTAGTVSVGDAATLTVDPMARAATRRNHSATHLLHWALRKVLGPHAQQKGSKVGPEGLRFDYAAARPLSADEVARIEDLVNAEVLANAPVRTEVTSQAEARAKGAMMIFEEKYGDSVRMLHIGSESVELCGGTHASRTGDIGLFKVVSDANVGAGVRRIEAVTGLGALALTRAHAATLQHVGGCAEGPGGRGEHPRREGRRAPEGAPEARSTSSSGSSPPGRRAPTPRCASPWATRSGRGPRARGRRQGHARVRRPPAGQARPRRGGARRGDPRRQGPAGGRGLEGPHRPLSRGQDRGAARGEGGRARRRSTRHGRRGWPRRREARRGPAGRVGPGVLTLAPQGGR